MCRDLSLVEFFKQYPDEAAATKYFENLRWKNGGIYPHCGSLHITKCKGPMPYRCKECRKHFSVRVGTIMDNSKLPLQKWSLAIYINYGKFKKRYSLNSNVGISWLYTKNCLVFGTSD